jgi:hypothetical protein
MLQLEENAWAARAVRLFGKIVSCLLPAAIILYHSVETAPTPPSQVESSVADDSEATLQARADKIAAAMGVGRASVPHDETARFAAALKQVFGIAAASSANQPGSLPRFPVSKVNRDGQIVYDQCDARWADIPYDPRNTCQTGCGPMAMAMIMSALGQMPFPPLTAIEYARDNGLYALNSGSSWTLPVHMARAHGFSARSVPTNVAEVNKALREKNMVWLCGNGAPPFTESGHCIAVRALTDDGRWKVFDSKTGRDPNTAYDPEIVVSQASPGSATAIGSISRPH